MGVRLSDWAFHVFGQVVTGKFVEAIGIKKLDLMMRFLGDWGLSWGWIGRIGIHVEESNAFSNNVSSTKQSSKIVI